MVPDEMKRCVVYAISQFTAMPFYAIFTVRAKPSLGRNPGSRPMLHCNQQKARKIAPMVLSHELLLITEPPVVGEAVVGFFRDDEVIDECDAHHFPRAVEAPGEIDVALRGQ